MHFPAYYELVPNTSKWFAKDKVYSEQVLDKIGQQGRPFAAVEEGRTVRALDLFGDYLLVYVSKRKRFTFRGKIRLISKQFLY